MEKAQTFHHGHPTSSSNHHEPANLTGEDVKKTRARTFSQPRKLHLRSRHGGSGNAASAHHALGISGTGSKTSSTAALISTALTSPLQVLPDHFRRSKDRDNTNTTSSAVPSRRTSLSSSRDPAPQTSTSATAPGLSPIGSPSQPAGFQPSLTTRLLAYPPNISLAPPRRKSAITAQQKHLTSLLEPREKDLTSSLAALTSAALAATRRLDTAYDDLLARSAALTSALLALRELHSSLSSSRENFDIRAEGLQGEADKLVAGYRDFEVPEKRVTALVDRLGAARERSVVAEEKLGGLKERVERWRVREVRKGRERWWFTCVFGGVMGVVVIAVVAWLLVSQTGPIEHVASPVGIRLADDTGGGKRDAQWKRVLDEL